MLQFQWDPAKASANRTKHGIDFSEAATAFGDPLSLTIPDPEHSVGEERFVLIGVSHRDRLVVVAHSEDGDVVRIISARSATPAERKFYEQD